ncbi:fimbrial protein [Dyella sp. BiH032]|uniref:fimbrial protein n=1 Tax=Dyella sp. BiH032 TaxID=3075430 RepID=UPI00289327FF|nr:fimbrial protein [Dyella sp. BiH032]WNL48319.1 fimbrial protein [Dyella sp. BiH032]
MRRVLLLLLTIVLGLPLAAQARCSFTSGGTANVNISFPNSTITIDPNLPVGAVLATSAQFSPSPVSQISCTGTTAIGVQNVAGSQPSSGSIIFPTGVAGIGYRVTHPDTSNYLAAYPGDSIASGSYQMSVTSGLEFVKTGPIANGATVSSGTMGYWRYDSNSNSRIENFNLGTTLTFMFPSCSVNTSTINVTLPTVSNTAFNGVGTVAGATVVPISLQCASGSQLYIQFDTANPVGGATGVIAPATGTGRAKNIGVQLINQSFTPVTFGTPALVGATPDGPLNLTYYARYYQTATPVAAGTVSATATFTLTYQ